MRNGYRRHGVGVGVSQGTTQESAHLLSNFFAYYVLAKKSISICVYGKLEEAEDRLANEALKYMEASYNKVLQDFNYEKLRLVQQKKNLWNMSWKKKKE